MNKTISLYSQGLAVLAMGWRAGEPWRIPGGALVFGWLLAAIGLLIVAVLATPLSITLRASVEDRLRWSLRMSLFGGIGPGLSVSDDTFAKDSTPGPSRPAQKAGRSRIKDPFRLLRPVGRLLGDIVGAFRLRMASLDVRRRRRAVRRRRPG